MKLSRTSLLVVTIGILIIVVAILALRCSQQTKEQDELSKKLASTEMNLKRVQLGQLSSKQAELEKQLSQATSQLEASKAAFAELAENTTAISIILKVAKANGMEVIEIKSPGPAKGTLDGLACWVTPLTAKVKGDTPKLVSFLLELNSYLTTGVIRSIRSGENASAEIEMVVYTYQGD